MNEIPLLRAQLAGEVIRASAVAEACLQALRQAGAAAPEPRVRAFRAACVQYLTAVLTAFEARDQRLLSLPGAPAGPAPAQSSLAQPLSLPGQSREALEKLAAAANSNAAHAERDWQAFAQFLAGSWRVRRDALDALLATEARVGYWRTMGGIDADTIMAERRSYAQVRALLPAGVSLPAPAAQRSQVSG